VQVEHRDCTAAITSSQRSRLDALCERAATGNRSGATTIAHEVCVQIVKDTVSSGSARNQVLECVAAMCKEL
jgi:hypothetical protein